MTTSSMRPLTKCFPYSGLCSSCAAKHSLSKPVVLPKLLRRPVSCSANRKLAQVQDERFSNAWFSPAAPYASNGVSTSRPPMILKNDAGAPPDPFNIQNPSDDKKPPDERVLKLGKTLRTLTPHLPTLLTSPQSVPQDILSPSISLHLFPSTHPHLPTVRGRVAYRAALWTAPVAWGSVPLVGGGCKLEIVSERMTRTGYGDVLDTDGRGGGGEEKLFIRWKTKKAYNRPSNSTNPSSPHSSSSPTPNPTAAAKASTNPRLLTLLGGGTPPLFPLSSNAEFTGLFIFLFDSEGRVRSHTIEHADEAGTQDKVGRVVTVADWLLARVKGQGGEEGKFVPGLASVRVWEGGTSLFGHRKR